MVVLNFWSEICYAFYIVYNCIRNHHNTEFKMITYLLDVRFYMNIWGVAVPELDSHLDRKKGPDHAPCAGP